MRWFITTTALVSTCAFSADFAACGKSINKEYKVPLLKGQPKEVVEQSLDANGYERSTTTWRFSVSGELEYYASVNKDGAAEIVEFKWVNGRLSEYSKFGVYDVKDNKGKKSEAKMTKERRLIGTSKYSYDQSGNPYKIVSDMEKIYIMRKPRNPSGYGDICVELSMGSKFTRVAFYESNGELTMKSSLLDKPDRDDEVGIYQFLLRQNLRVGDIPWKYQREMKNGKLYTKDAWIGNELWNRTWFNDNGLPVESAQEIDKNTIERLSYSYPTFDDNNNWMQMDVSKHLFAGMGAAEKYVWKPYSKSTRTITYW